MATRTINGMQARRLATYGLTAGVVLSVSAVSLWALQIPGMKSLPDKPAPLPPPAVAETNQKAAAPKVDAETVSAMGDRLDLAVVHPDKPTVAVETPVPPPVSEGPEWTYLGPIHEATRTLAMVSVGGSQKILPEGRVFGDTKLVSVADDKITVEIKGTPKTIDRGARDASKSVAWVRNIQNAAPPPNAGQPGVPGPPGGARGALPPEVQARLAQRGMTPEQIQNFRQGRDGRGGNNGNGNGGGGGPRGRDFRGNGNGNFNGATDSRQRAVPMPPASDSVDGDVRRVN